MNAAIPPEEMEPSLSLGEVRQRLETLSDGDLARLEDFAQGLADGLPGVAAEDLVQEALVRMLCGRRRHPRDLPTVVAVFGVMKSLANAARRHAKGAVDWKTIVDDAGDGSGTPDAREAGTNPESAMIAKDLMARLDEALAGDDAGRLVLEAWNDGIRGEEAAQLLGFSFKEYEAARKRVMRRWNALTK